MQGSGFRVQGLAKVSNRSYFSGVVVTFLADQLGPRPPIRDSVKASLKTRAYIINTRLDEIPAAQLLVPFETRTKPNLINLVSR